MAPISLRFEAHLNASVDEVWTWITSLRGISREMWPYFRMTTPRDIQSLNEITLTPGKPMFRSYVFLFGLLPIDYSDLTLIELDPGRGFVEQSPMGSMRLWRHERRLHPTSDTQGVVTLVDQLTFEPRFASRLVGWFINHVFTHRHQVLKHQFNGAEQ